MTLNKLNTISVHLCLLIVFSTVTGCLTQEHNDLELSVFQTSASGDKMTPVSVNTNDIEITGTIKVNSNKMYQTFTGFGGAFTESSAFVLNQLNTENQERILAAYFADTGARYSLTRTHMNSCDFSVDHYSYAPVPDDTLLTSFSIFEDTSDIIPMIKRAQVYSTDGFKIIASPWTAPIWMKDNKTWNGGKLLPKYYPVWAKFFSKYANAYAKEGIDIWAFTVENEPLGNDAHWESMHYSPKEMVDFVKHHLGPQLRKDQVDAKILMYDQNRGKELDEWVSVYLKDTALLPYIYGTAVHWYTSTIDFYPNSLTNVHNLAPDKHVIHTEGCIDSETPHWNDDRWYWQKEATDWGWDWAAEEDKKDHPKYVPCFRYARDIIGCMNNHVEGWVDWNMILDVNGGPNLAQNWCIAPVIADIDKDEIYFTPLYYIMSHFSKYVRPEAKRIDIVTNHNDLNTTAVKNADDSTVVIVFNESNNRIHYKLNIDGKESTIVIDKKAIQTIIVK
jgi:glucosylceramidase